MAIQVGSDGFLQLVVRGGLLEPQAQIVLQVLVQLVTWKEQEQVNKHLCRRPQRSKHRNALR